MPPPYTYNHPRPSVTVDLVVFSSQAGAPRVLMIQRKRDPFAGRWAIPGGFLEIDEPIEIGARRELKEETGLEIDGPIAFLGVWGRPGRDPRGRTISLVHVTRVSGPPPTASGSDDAATAAWLDPNTLADLAFDHDEILRAALDWLGRQEP